MSEEVKLVKKEEHFKRIDELRKRGLVLSNPDSAFIGVGRDKDFYVPFLDVCYTPKEKWNKILKGLDQEKAKRDKA